MIKLIYSVFLATNYKIKLLFFISTIFISCNKANHSNTATTEVRDINQNNPFFNLGDFKLYLNADEEDFKISDITKDTIKIEKILYRTLDGALIKPRKGVNIKSIKEVITIDMLQYTIDDNPATPLGLNISLGNDENNINSYQLKSIKENQKLIHNTDFKKIINKSITYQTKFYNQLLKNENKYIDCCKEYITKAKDFTNSDKNKFKNFQDLNLEPIIKKRIIEIKYIHSNIEKKKIIIYN